ncbi:hypothetical protein [Methylobacterium soli]|uniref:Uncharacterized protein n=1 Tax=Methylobacterium soli TaxID=553447 RepID=A0A6L3ST36_9HYPH|nr:hypothetical protein [Methylobacterium soli]KAB1072899.1 hypothetical protein F6X53_27770 [Methylobacterium soli]
MTLKSGLYLLRYVSADDRRYPPRVLVAVDPDQSDGLSFQPMPGRVHNLLRKPGEVLIVSVDGEARLLVSTLREAAGISDTIVLKVDRLDGAETASAPVMRGALPGPVPPAAPAPAPLPARALRLGAHIERVGDMIVDSPDWIGSETSRARIEGLSLFWPNRPEGIDIEYSVSLLGRGRLPNTLTGGFVGSRGQGRAINGIFMNLVGPRAAGYRLVAEAIFSDGTRNSSRDGGVQLFGPTGREYLVGLSINLEEVAMQDAVAQPRIFRSESAAFSSPHVLHQDASNVSDLPRLPPRLQIRRPLRSGG